MLHPHHHTTPSERTGPPRSISLISLPNSWVVSQTNPRKEDVYPLTETMTAAAGPSTQQNQNDNLRSPELKHNEPPFCDTLEYDDPNLRERPKGERPPFEFRVVSGDEKARTGRRPNSLSPQHDSSEKPTTAPRRGRLRPLPAVVTQSQSWASQAGGSGALARHNTNIPDALLAGGLATIMLKLWFERDENGHRRVPILLHLLRIRISDSLHPLDGNKAVFRIECEYANGAARWVIYRQLKEFISLHTYYAFPNAYNRNIEALPEFPKAIKKVKVGHAEFTRTQREALEKYLVGVIRALVI